MTDILSTEKIGFFLIFFIPGFISIKTWNMLIPTERIDFSKSFLEVIVYSSFNFAALSWLIIIISSNKFPKDHPFLYPIFTVFILLIMPIFWPIILLNIYKCKFIAKYIISPFQKPWDFVFSKRKSYWIIVHFRDRRLIGGLYSGNSFASSAPAPEQIYLEQVWILDEKGGFKEPVPSSNGIIIMGNEVLAIEFFTNQE